ASTPARDACSGDDEVEASHAAAFPLPHVHQQALVEDEVAPVARFIREVELGRQHAAAASRDLHMEMTGPPGIEARHDRREPEAAILVRELVAAQSKAVVVVAALAVGVPQ